MTGRPLTDGLLGLHSGDFTRLMVWEVEFSCFVLKPHVAVPPDTDLNTVEKIARASMWQEYSQGKRDSDGRIRGHTKGGIWELVSEATIATLTVLHVRRLDPVYVDPRVA